MRSSTLKRGSILDKFNSQKYLQLLALPALIWMIVFCYLPMIGIVLSFTDYTLKSPMSFGNFVGFKHFIEFFNSDDFFNVMKNTIGISFFKLLFGFPLPIIFALLLNEIRSEKLKRTVQTISYLPHFLSWVILGGILINWLSDTGLITRLLVNLGIIGEPIFFLGDPKYFWGIAVISDVWKEVGFSAIIYIAAITSIDPGIYEAATIDGASRWAKIRYITLPGISQTIAILLIMQFGNMLSTNFDQIMALTNAANRAASDVLDVFSLRMGMSSGRFSYSTAISLTRSGVSVMLLFIANFISKKLLDKSLF